MTSIPQDVAHMIATYSGHYHQRRRGWQFQQNVYSLRCPAPMKWKTTHYINEDRKMLQYEIRATEVTSGKTFIWKKEIYHNREYKPRTIHIDYKQEIQLGLSPLDRWWYNEFGGKILV